MVDALEDGRELVGGERDAEAEVEVVDPEAAGRRVPLEHLRLAEVPGRPDGVRDRPGRDVREPPVEDEERDVGEGVAEGGHLPVDDGRDAVPVVGEAVVEPVVAVDDARTRLRLGRPDPCRERLPEPRLERALGRQGLLHLASPPSDLPLEEAVRAPEVGEPDRGRVDPVQRGEGVDHPLAHDPGALRAEGGQLAGRAVGAARNVGHDVEGCADDGLVLAQGVRRGDRDVRARERGHDPVLARHVVGGREDVPERGPTDDPGPRTVTDAVREVRLAARDVGDREVPVTGERGRRVVAEGASPPGGERRRVEPGDGRPVVRAGAVGGRPVAHGTTTLMTSATQPGLAPSSISTVTFVRTWWPPPPGSTESSSTPARTRAPTGTGAG